MLAVSFSMELLYETLGISGITTNPFEANVPILYPPKTPGVFSGYKMGTLARNGFTHFVPIFSLTHFMPLVSFYIP